MKLSKLDIRRGGGIMGEGLAAHVVSNMYGNGEGNTVKHYYDRGSKPKTKTKKKEEKKNGK